MKLITNAEKHHLDLAQQTAYSSLEQLSQRDFVRHFVNYLSRTEFNNLASWVDYLKAKYEAQITRPEEVVSLAFHFAQSIPSTVELSSEGLMLFSQKQVESYFRLQQLLTHSEIEIRPMHRIHDILNVKGIDPRLVEAAEPYLLEFFSFDTEKSNKLKISIEFFLSLLPDDKVDEFRSYLASPIKHNVKFFEVDIWEIAKLAPEIQYRIFATIKSLETVAQLGFSQTGVIGSYQK